MAGQSTYEPETHWAGRALQSGGDPLRAACLDDPIQNAGIDRVQRRVLTAAFERLEQLRPLRGSRLLDYGCGPGRWVPFFQQWGCQYSGVDLVEPMLAIARRRWPAAELRRLEGDRIPYGPGTFDVATSIAVLHHNGYPVQARILAELKRVLRPGGYLLLFEAVGRHAPPGVGESPRPLAEWVALAGTLGLHLRWHRGARYAILAAAVGKLRRVWGASNRSSVARQSARSRILPGLDAVIDPWLLPLLPKAYQTRVAMLFHRPPDDSDVTTTA